MFNAVIDAPFGKVGIRLEAGTVREIVYLPESIRNVEPDTPLAQEAARQIECYLERASAGFDLPLASVGTAFQQRVWAAISEIPPGVIPCHRVDDGFFRKVKRWLLAHEGVPYA
jgi:methylated-DNA-[protein]-cysteine S-methyltransferase